MPITIPLRHKVLNANMPNASSAQLGEKMIPQSLRKTAMEEDMVDRFSLSFAKDTPVGRNSHKGCSSLENIHRVNTAEHCSSGGDYWVPNSFKGKIAFESLRGNQNLKKRLARKNPRRLKSPNPFVRKRRGNKHTLKI